VEREGQEAHHAPGTYPCKLEARLARPPSLYRVTPGQLAATATAYEVQQPVPGQLQEAGPRGSGRRQQDLDLVEMKIRAPPEHPNFVGLPVFHPPQFQQAPFAPHPLFSGFRPRSRLSSPDGKTP